MHNNHFSHSTSVGCVKTIKEEKEHEKKKTIITQYHKAQLKLLITICFSLVITILLFNLILYLTSLFLLYYYFMNYINHTLELYN